MWHHVPGVPLYAYHDTTCLPGAVLGTEVGTGAQAPKPHNSNTYLSCAFYIVIGQL